MNTSWDPLLFIGLLDLFLAVGLAFLVTLKRFRGTGLRAEDFDDMSD